MRILKKILVLVFGFSLFGAVGCATDIEFLAKIPPFEAYSDKIPGLTPPHERIKMIRLKGEKGKTANESEKKIIVAQLMVEYRTSPDNNMRRESVDALAKISHEKRDQYMKEILGDEDPFIRISALEAIGSEFSGSKTELAQIIAGHLKTDPDKDVRLTAARLLGKLGHGVNGVSSGQLDLITHAKNPEAAKIVVNSLGDALLDKIPAIRYQAMVSLHEATGKDYGKDINRWIQYIQHVRGEGREQPKERTFAEKLPTVQLPMFK